MHSGSVRAPLWLLILGAACFTAVCLQHSLEQGRLAQPPLYDDVAYLLDGAHRVNQYYAAGVPRVLRGLADRPPKSPYSTLAAGGAFLTLGLHDWAPYVTNVLVILTLLYAVWRAGSRLPPWARLAMTLLALALPIAARSVTEFRPDLLSALLVALGAVLALEGPLTATRKQVLVGACFGAAMFVKPTSAPATGLLWALTAGLALLPELPAERRARAWALGLLVSLSALVVLPALYATIGAEFTWTYLRFNLWGPGRALWVRPMSGAEQAAYYVTGPSGRYMLGLLGVPLLVLVGLDVLLAWARGTRADLARAAFRVLVLAAAYAIAVRTPIKNAFFGAQFQALLLVFGAVGLARVLEEMGRLRIRRLPLRLVVLAGAWIAALATYTMPGRFPAGDPFWRDEVAALYDGIYGAVRQRLLPGRQTRLFLAYTGFINSANLQFRAYADRLPLAVRSAEMRARPEQYDGLLRWADLVLALPEGTSHDIGRFPSVRMLDDVVDSMDARTDFVRIATFPVERSRRRDAPGRHAPAYILYARRPPFEGWTMVEGLSVRRAVADPGVPDGVHRGRWTGTVLEVESTGGPALLRMSCRTIALEPLDLIVTHAGREVGLAPVPGRLRWHDFEYPLDLPPGRSEVRLDYRGSGEGVPLEFRVLRVEGVNAPPPRP